MNTGQNIPGFVSLNQVGKGAPYVLEAGHGQHVAVNGGIRSLLTRTAGVRIDHVIEHVAARRAEPHEAKLLGIPRSAPVLALYVSARDASGQPLLALDVAMPGDLHELEDAYPVG